jgi:hypothetical protein
MFCVTRLSYAFTDTFFQIYTTVQSKLGLKISYRKKIMSQRVGGHKSAKKVSRII